MLQKFAGPLVGAPFCGAPVRPNMLNMPKSASDRPDRQTDTTDRVHRITKVTVKIKGTTVHWSTGAAHLPFIIRPLKSVTRGQCDARSTITFPTAERNRPLTKLCIGYNMVYSWLCECNEPYSTVDHVVTARQMAFDTQAHNRANF